MRLNALFGKLLALWSLDRHILQKPPLCLSCVLNSRFPVDLDIQDDKYDAVQGLFSEVLFILSSKCLLQCNNPMQVCPNVIIHPLSFKCLGSLLYFFAVQPQK